MFIGEIYVILEVLLEVVYLCFGVNVVICIFKFVEVWVLIGVFVIGEEGVGILFE